MNSISEQRVFEYIKHVRIAHGLSFTCSSTPLMHMVIFCPWFVLRRFNYTFDCCRFFFFNSCSLNIQARPNEIIMSTDWNIYIYTWYTSLSTCGLESMTKAKVRCIKCNLLSVHRIYLYAILWSVWVWVLLDFGSNYCCSQSRLHGSLYFCTQKHRSARTHRHTYIYIYAHAYIYAQRVHQRIPKIVPPKYMCTYRVSVSV